MTLQFYLARRFLGSLGLVLGMIGLMLFLIELVEVIRRLSGSGVGLGAASGLAALGIAGSVYAVLPLVALLAAIWLFLGLARSSELVAIRAAGRSAVRLLNAPVLTAALVGAVAVAVLNPVVAATERRLDEAFARLTASGAQTVSVGGEGLWLRQGLPDGGQLVIRAARADAEATTLAGASFWVFRAGTGPVRRIEAARAVLAPGEWVLEDAADTPLDAANPAAATVRTARLTLATDLTAQRIRDGFGKPEAVPIWQLPGFVAALERAGFSAVRHRVWIAAEATRPLLMAAMVAIAAGFTLQHVRGARVARAVLLAFGAGVGLYFLRALAQVLAETGQIGPWAAALAPPAAGLMLAYALILQREDG